MTYEHICRDHAVRVYIAQADASLEALGFTEHSFAHVTKVAQTAGYLLERLGYQERIVELTKIAGFLHDIGNVVNRVDHSQSGAVMAFRILDRMDFPPEEIASIVTAIGNHDEGTGVPVSPLAAALILADNIYLMEECPGGIKLTLQVPWNEKTEENRKSEAFFTLKNKLLNEY